MSGDPIELVLITITQIRKGFLRPMAEFNSRMVEYPIFCPF
jgi:hypothetical protein